VRHQHRHRRGQCAGALVEALTAGTPLLHLTGQIESEYLDRDLAYIHEAPAQLQMLQAVGKAAFRVRNAETALATLREAVQLAFTRPCGPVSIEIPIDIQARADRPAGRPRRRCRRARSNRRPPRCVRWPRACRARRPLLWLGGGARGAGKAVERFVALGWGVVTTVQGRGVVPEDHPACLGSYNLQPRPKQLYGTCDAMLVVGSRLRSNETLKYELKLPRPLLRIDVDAAAEGRCYASDGFVCGDSALALNGLADRLEKRRLPGRPRAAHRPARRARAGGGLAARRPGPVR
jgi:acetolactate synthase-1/2/3 large subunit